MLLFSLIVPTRGRRDGLRWLLQSLRGTAANPESVEVVAVMDEDDLETQAVTSAGLRLEKVVVPRGLTMGQLNLAGQAAASGQYLMLLNDDVIARTKGWDTELRRVFETYPDGIVLAHTNDLLFRDTLCIFPCVTRTFCELAGGICPSEYRRYRIDDHVHNIFDLIHLLGHTRRVFLPQVIFEHTNTAAQGGTARQYAPDPAILGVDHRHFEDLLPQRRQLALDCLDRIEGQRRSKDPALAQFLEQFPDSIGLRHREYAIWWPRITPTIPSQPGRMGPAVRMAFRFWEMAALIGARWPALARLGIGLPPELFDSVWYKARYPEVAQSREHPLRHYLRRGGFEGYNPNPHFDSNWYLATNPDVAASGLNPLVHFYRYGKREGRCPEPRFPPAIRQFVRVDSPAPISVVIPTRNRRDLLLRTLEACQQHRSGCEQEFLIIDDGSKDETSALLQELAATMSNLRWKSQPPLGPAHARNVGASLARHDVLLFLGDDILPANDEFFRVHALRHAQHPEPEFAVLGKVEWPCSVDFPVNFIMRHIEEDGSQFAYSRLVPGGLASWQFFYTSNVSVKKSLVGDWMTGGFDTGFGGAALEDVELAYRLEKSGKGARLYYAPASLGLHYHRYSLDSFLERQYRAGRSLRHMLELHPELADAYGIRQVDAALRRPHRRHDAETAQRSAAAIDTLKNAGRNLEARDLLGTEDWHGDFLSAVFELCLHDGYACAWPTPEVNLPAARGVILERFYSRLGKATGKLPLHPVKQ